MSILIFNFTFSSKFVQAFENINISSSFFLSLDLWQLETEIRRLNLWYNTRGFVKPYDKNTARNLIINIEIIFAWIHVNFNFHFLFKIRSSFRKY